jgi:hypothetical protein
MTSSRKGQAWYVLRGYPPRGSLTQAFVTRLPLVLISHPGVKANNLKELIALAKANPDEAGLPG